MDQDRIIRKYVPSERSRTRSKNDKDDALKAGLATAGGAASGTGVYLTGYGGKYWAKAQRKKWTKAQQSQLHEYRKQTPDNTSFFRNYPKNLPGANMQRLLGRTHAGKSGLAVNVGTAALGGAAGYAAYDKAKKEPVKKNEALNAAKARMQMRLDNSTNMSPDNRAKLQRQIKAIDDKLSAGPVGPQDNVAPRKVKPPTPKASNPITVKSVLAGTTKRGFYVPAAAIGSAGVAGYAIRRRTGGNH